jgi:hypothetical protein
MVNSLPQLGLTFKQSLQLYCLRKYCVAMYILKNDTDGIEKCIRIV